MVQSDVQLEESNNIGKTLNLTQKDDFISPRQPSLEQSRLHWLEKNRAYYDDLKRFFKFHVEPGSRVLEIGFGVGSILKSVNPSLGVGIDVSEEALEEAKDFFSADKNLEFFYWNGSDSISPEFKKKFQEGFDYILLVNTMGLWSDVQASLEKLKPFCHPNTRIIANYYNFLWAPALKLAQIFGRRAPQPTQNWLSKDDVANLFRISGYQVVKKSDRCLIPIDLGFFSKFINQYLSPFPLISKLSLTHTVIARPPHKHDPKDVKVSVVIPARNEKGNIESAIKRMAAVAKRRTEKYEIIFIEGNSTDDTWAEIQRVHQDQALEKPFDVLIAKQEGKGKGDAVRKGFSMATGNFLTILDADLTMPPEDLPKFVDVFCQGHGEFINGCRLIYKMEKEAMRPINLMGNKFFSWAFTWLLSQRFKDTLCGTKAISRHNYDRLVRGRHYFGDFDPFGDFDLIFGASKLDLEITEVPIRYKDRVYGQTNIDRWRHGWLLLKMCVYALNKIKFVP